MIVSIWSLDSVHNWWSWVYDKTIIVIDVLSGLILQTSSHILKLYVFGYLYGLKISWQRSLSASILIAEVSFGEGLVSRFLLGNVLSWCPHQLISSVEVSFSRIRSLSMSILIAEVFWTNILMVEALMSILMVKVTFCRYMVHVWPYRFRHKLINECVS